MDREYYNELEFTTIFSPNVKLATDGSQRILNVEETIPSGNEASPSMVNALTRPGFSPYGYIRVKKYIDLPFRWLNMCNFHLKFEKKIPLIGE